MGRRKTVTRRPTFGDAIAWIAENDNDGQPDRRHYNEGSRR